MKHLHEHWQSLIKNFYDDQARFVLWGPVFLGIGIIAYLSLSKEPFFLIAPILLLLISAILFISRRLYLLKHIITALFLIVLGFTITQARTLLFPTPMLQNEVNKVSLVGTVVETEVMHGKIKITVDSIQTDPPLRLEKVRLYHNVSKNHPAPPLKPGTRIRVTANLSPISKALLPNGFDFRRKAYFEGMSAYGFTEKNSLTRLTPKEKLSFKDHINKIRDDISNKIRASLNKPTSTVATALITGDKSSISKKNRQAFANSGIAHLLAISGLHLSLVGGFVFVSLRLLLSLFPQIALRFNTKKIAAIFAILATFSYMLISGSATPSQRSFMMTLIVMLAVLTDRKAISMRSVALAAFLILCLFPHVITTPSFQLSFAAVISLIAFYEVYSHKLAHRFHQDSFAFKVLTYFAGLLITSAIATIATTPFTIYHFGQFTVQSLLTNMIAIPLMGFWIMPIGFISLLLMPFGIHDIPLSIMGHGIDIIIQLAHTISSWPGALIRIPKPDPLYLGLFVMGGLWLCLWYQKWRLLSIPVVLASLVLFFVPSPQSKPDVLISQDGRLIGVYLQDRTLLVSAFRHNRFTRDIWESALAPKQTLLFPYKKSYKNFDCTGLYCVLNSNKDQLAIPQFKKALYKAKNAHLDILDATESSKSARTILYHDKVANGEILQLRKGFVKGKMRDRPWS